VTLEGESRHGCDLSSDHPDVIALGTLLLITTNDKNDDGCTPLLVNVIVVTPSCVLEVALPT